MLITNLTLKNNENKTFASVDVNFKNKEKKLLIECSQPSIKVNSLDAFLPLVLLDAIDAGEDIIVDGAISSDLFYRLNEFLLPILCNAFNTKKIKLKANTTIHHEIPSKVSEFFNCTYKDGVVKISDDSSSFDVCINYQIEQNLFNNHQVASTFLQELSAGLFVSSSVDYVELKLPEQCGHLKYITSNFYDYVPLFAHTFSIDCCKFGIDCTSNKTPDTNSKYIKIGPISHRVENNKCRVESQISFDGRKEILYFESSSDISDYMVKDRCDAFIVILLAYALRNGYNITSEVPASAELLKKIKKFLIPNLSSRLKVHNFINIDIPETNAPLENIYGGFGTGFSGGVDSMYTVAKNQHLPKEYRLTHLAIFNAGVFECDDPNKIFTEALSNITKFANKLDMKAIGLSSNIDEIIRTPYHNECTIRLCACALMLGGLLNNYVLSSSKSFNYLGFSEFYCDSYEALLIYTFSTSYIKFHSCGEELNRLQKIKYLSVQPDIFCDNLHPCVHNPIFGQKNCNTCPKCIRMLFTAGQLNKLDKFSKAFNVEHYKKHKQEIDAKIVSSSLNNSFDEELIDEETLKNLSPDLKRRVKGLAAVKNLIKNNRQKLIDKSKDKGLIVDKYIYK